MSVDETKPGVTSGKPTRGRGGLVLFVALLVALLVGAAYFQEELGYVVSLQVWDAGKPKRTVEAFLKAGRDGKQSEADRAIDTNLYKPLTEGDRFVGYQQGTPMGTLEFRFSELAGAGEINATSGEFVFKGNGAAMVTVPDAKGSPIAYRLVMQNGGWQITEIRGGSLRK